MIELSKALEGFHELKEEFSSAINQQVTQLPAALTKDLLFASEYDDDDNDDDFDEEDEDLFDEDEFIEEEGYEEDFDFEEEEEEEDEDEEAFGNYN